LIFLENEHSKCTKTNQMNKDVLNKLSKIERKVELAEVRVDLAKISDLEAAYQKGRASVDKANALSVQLGDAVTLWNKTFAPLKNEITSVEQSITDGYKLISVLQKQASDLGITEIPEVNKIEGYLQGFGKTASALRGAVNDNKNRMNTQF
jgi:uncharacterized protein YhaN